MPNLKTGASPQTYRFSQSENIPNNPKFPLLLYSQIVEGANGDIASFFEDLYRKSDWGNSWRDGVYPFHHYHSNAHEVLAVYEGSAQIHLGGPDGDAFDLSKGDVVVIPAGVGHKRISASSDFGVVGAYPEGKSYDLIRNDTDLTDDVVDRIANLAAPGTDPLYGENGPLPELWNADAD